MYVVLSGMLGVKLDHLEDSETILNKSLPRDSVGATTMIGRQKRATTVIAIANTRLIRLSHTFFNQLSDRARKLLIDPDTITQRLRNQQLHSGCLHPCHREW